MITSTYSVFEYQPIYTSAQLHDTDVLEKLTVAPPFNNVHT